MCREKQATDGLAMRDAAHGAMPLRHPPHGLAGCRAARRTGHFPGGTPRHALPHHAQRRTVKCRGRRTAGTAKALPAVDTHLIELEQLIDRLRIPFAGGVQQAPPLIQFFFLGMRCRSSFHCCNLSTKHPARCTAFRHTHYIVQPSHNKGIYGFLQRFFQL